MTEAERELMQEALRWIGGGSVLEVWEDVADWFRSETGMLRPGKDQPRAMSGSPSEAAREAAWEAWRTKKKEEIVARLSSALESPPGEDLALASIRTDGLQACYTQHDRNGFPHLWTVNRLTGEGCPYGEGQTISGALAAYRAALTEVCATCDNWRGHEEWCDKFGGTGREPEGRS